MAGNKMSHFRELTNSVSSTRPVAVAKYESAIDTTSIQSEPAELFDSRNLTTRFSGTKATTWGRSLSGKVSNASRQWQT